MRVAYVCADPGVPVFGTKGCSVHVREVIRALRRAGHHVTLLATRLGGDAPADLTDLEIVTLPSIPAGSAGAREEAALAANAALRSALKDIRGIDVVYERHALWSHAAMAAARDIGAVGVLEVNAPLLDEQQRYRTLIHADEAAQSVSMAYAGARAIVAVSDGVANAIRRHPGPTGTIYVVPNGVDPRRFDGVRQRAADDVVVGFVGTIRAWHGVETLVDAFAMLHADRPASRLLIVGGGPSAAAIQQRIGDASLGSVTEMTGSVDSDRIPELIEAMDIAVAPYPELEGFYFSPLKLFEYMAAQRAIVASDIGQIGRVVAHEREALLTAPGDVEALAAALRRLYDDGALRDRLGRSAARVVRSRYTWDAVATRIIDIAGAHARDVAEAS